VKFTVEYPLESTTNASLGDGLYAAENLPGPARVVFGGQILTLAVVVASRFVRDKQLKNLRTVFARGGDPDQPLEFDVQVLQMVGASPVSRSPCDRAIGYVPSQRHSFTTRKHTSSAIVRVSPTSPRVR
jgi:hypothetical protein